MYPWGYMYPRLGTPVLVHQLVDFFRYCANAGMHSACIKPMLAVCRSSRSIIELISGEKSRRKLILLRFYNLMTLSVALFFWSCKFITAMYR